MNSEKLKQYCIKYFAQHLPDVYSQFHQYNLFSLKFEMINQKIQVFNDHNGFEKLLYKDVAVNTVMSVSSPTKVGYLKLKNNRHGIHHLYIDNFKSIVRSSDLFSGLEDDGFEICSLPEIAVDLSAFNKAIPTSISPMTDTKDIVDLCCAITNLVKNKSHALQFANKFIQEHPTFDLNGTNGARILNEYRKFKTECPDT